MAGEDITATAASTYGRTDQRRALSPRKNGRRRFLAAASRSVSQRSRARRRISRRGAGCHSPAVRRVCPRPRQRLLEPAAGRAIAHVLGHRARFSSDRAPILFHSREVAARARSSLPRSFRGVARLPLGHGPPRFE